VTENKWHNPIGKPSRRWTQENRVNYERRPLDECPQEPCGMAGALDEATSAKSNDMDRLPRPLRMLILTEFESCPTLIALDLDKGGATLFSGGFARGWGDE
jgi:hypothetical protein